MNVSESKIGGISARGWITVMIVLTVCTLAVMQVTIPPELAAGFGAALGFYYGQKTK